MMDENLVLSRIRLADFLACQRRFQLRYLERLPWPAAQLKPEAERSRLLGQQFHTILHRHFLGLLPGRDAAADPALQKWLGLFLHYEPKLPAGRRYPELTLTVPIGSKMLTGRFDLFVISEEEAYIFDWKTQEKARPASELEDDLQTRIYLALAAEGSQALGRKVNPEQLSLIYWYASDPPTTVSITYGEKEHAHNLAFLKEIVRDISNQLHVDGQWPLTDDLRQCGRCAYQIFCGRKPGDIDLSSWEEQEDLVYLEPDHP